jgi:hypothetical protein
MLLGVERPMHEHDELDEQLLDADLWEMTRMLQLGKVKVEVRPTPLPRGPLEDAGKVFGVGVEYRPSPCPICNMRHWNDEEAEACCNPGIPLPATVIERVVELIWQGGGLYMICSGLGFCEERIKPITDMVDTIYAREHGLYGAVGKQRAVNARESKTVTMSGNLGKTWPPTRVPRHEVERRARMMCL